MDVDQAGANVKARAVDHAVGSAAVYQLAVINV
jgi:hypothetical protein